MHYMLSSRVALGYSDENDDIEYYVVVDGEQYYQVSPDLYFKLEKADGLHPLDIDKELISELESLNIISNHRIQRSGIFNHFIILLIGSRADKFRKIAKIFNMLLPCLGIVSLLVGIVARTISDIVIPYNVHSYGYSLLTLYIVLLLTLVLHELAHFNAAVAYEQEVSDIGLLLLIVLPVGAYIRKDAMNDYEDMSFEERKKIKKQNIQIDLAGIEMHMLLIGLSLITQSLIPSLNEVTDAIVVVNSIMLIVNLLPCFGLDGEQALSDFFETNNISRFAFKALYNKKYRSKLFHSGHLGYIVLIVFIVIYLAHLTLIAFFVYDIYAWLLLLFD